MRLRQLHVKIGMCSLNNDPLDFKNNYQHIMISIRQCIKFGCSIRVGGQLEICGYGCSDHFSEYDTIYHSWDVIRDILKSGITDQIVCEVGCPVLHKAALYNSRIVMYQSKIIAIRPKIILADGGNYFQTRHFASWKGKREIGEFLLPQNIQEVTKQIYVPIGIFIIDFNDTTMAYEICEQSWISNNPMIDASLDGAEIFVNPSASDLQRGKLKRKIQMIEEFTERHGGSYLYTNVKGVIGDRTLFDGGCIFSENGKVKYLSSLFNLQKVQVMPVVANLNAIRTFRLSNKSFLKETHNVAKIPRVKIDKYVAICQDEYMLDSLAHKQQLQRIRDIYEFPHATYQPSLFLWDILRKSRARGFFLALSGGLDSCSVALIIYNMCQLIFRQISMNKKQEVLEDLRRILRTKQYIPKDSKQICSKILFTCYMATENSSEVTKNRASEIGSTIGSNHRSIVFDQIYHAYQKLGQEIFNFNIKFKSQGGSWRTDLALQNIQARSRMLLAYFISQIELEQCKADGFLLVLGSSNLDESLRGYFTKYDCSSADYNPIGSFSKNRLRQIMTWNLQKHHFKFIEEIMSAPPTAELRPLKNGEIAQTDEEDMGLTYNDLELFGKLRKNENLGPVSMFDHIYSMRKYEQVSVLSEKIKLFFKFYGINRHKITVMTPSFHYDPQSCDDNRFDMRPMMYTTDWSYQFDIIDERVKEIMVKTSKTIKEQ